MRRLLLVLVLTLPGALVVAAGLRDTGVEVLGRNVLSSGPAGDLLGRPGKRFAHTRGDFLGRMCARFDLPWGRWPIRLYEWKGR